MPQPKDTLSQHMHPCYAHLTVITICIWASSYNAISYISLELVYMVLTGMDCASLEYLVHLPFRHPLDACAVAMCP